MNNILFIAISLTFLLSESSASLYKKNSSATVRIDTIIPDTVLANDGSCGTGFIIEHTGVIVTNHHVIDGAKEIIVELENGIKYNVQGFYYVDENLDIAIMKIPAYGLPTVTLGNSNNLEVLDEVFTIGNPLCNIDANSKNTSSMGNVSQRYTDENGVDWIKFTAPISGGNSGGPLFNMNGEVIGINTATWIGDAQNLNLAVPINYARGYIESGLSFINMKTDYDYLADSWDRYYPEHLNTCYDLEDVNEEECDCIFDAKKENFEHWHYVEFTDEFIDIVDEKCFNQDTVIDNSKNQFNN